jgi:hypothetical protein
MQFSCLLLSLIALPSQADTVLVCPPALRAAIEPWRAFRSAQGHQIAVVPCASSAEQTRAQIRQAAKGGKLRFIVLVGDADLPSPSDLSASCGVPTHYVPAKVNLHWGSEPEIATDNWYADLDDDQLPDAAVGRLSADTPDQLAAIVRKIVSYERRTGPVSENGQGADEWRRRINLVAGLGGFGAVVDTALEAAARSIVTGGIPAEYSTSFTQASWRSPYCPPPASFCDTVIDRMNEGCLFWVYIGHGRPRELDRLQVPGEEHSIFRAEDIDRVAARRGPPIALFLACYTAAYDAQSDCLAEELLRAEGGPVAVIGGSRVTMPYAMSVLGMEMLKECFVSRRPTIGDVLLHAKRNLVLGARTDERSQQIDSIASLLSPAKSDLADERLEHVHLFNLLGDPLLRLVHPLPVKIEAPSTVLPGDRFALSGACAVEGPATVELTLRRDRLKFQRAPREVYAATSEAGDDYRRTYEAANDIRLASVTTVARYGKFAAELTVPDDAHGPCHVRVFVQGKGNFASGAASVHVAKTRR